MSDISPLYCSAAGCQSPVVYRATQCSEKSDVRDIDFCEEHFKEFFKVHRPNLGIPIKQPSPNDDFVQIYVALVAVNFNSEVNQLITLRQINAPKRLHLLSGVVEACVISWYLNRRSSLRPLTHEAFVRCIELLNGRLTAVKIYGHNATTNSYLARIEMEQDGRDLGLEVRPSDGICLALITGVPIFANESFLRE